MINMYWSFDTKFFIYFMLMNMVGMDKNWDLGTIEGNFIKEYPKGANVQLLLQPEDLEHDDTSNLKLEVVDRKFRGTNFIYTLRAPSNTLIPVFVHSHHIHQHEVDEKIGIKRPIHIDHIVCF